MLTRKMKERIDALNAVVRALKEEYDERIQKLEAKTDELKKALEESEDARRRAEEVERRYYDGVNSIMNYNYEVALNAAKGVKE